MTSSIPAPRIAVPEAIDQEALRGFDRAAPLVVLQGQTMGTTWRIVAAVPQTLKLDAQGIKALAQARLDRIVAEMSHWEPGSQLCRFNRAEAASMMVLPADFARVLACAFRIADACGGAFDPALGRLTDAWGLGPRKVTTAPDTAAIADALAHSGWRRLAFDPQGRVLRQPGGVWLDLSGIAKGFAVDALAATLAKHGVRHALVEVGGECTGRGMRPDGEPWWVDVEVPEGMTVAPLRVALHQLAIATSGDYLRGAHTIDPMTGRPAIHAITAVTVLHRNCMEADAWATALSVLPPESASRTAREQKLAARLLARDGTEWISPALAAMF